MMLADFLRDIYVPLKQISEKTESLYRLTIAEFGKSLGHEPSLSDFDELKVARFLAKRVRERQPATAAKDRSQIRAMWELAARRRMVDSWPTISRIKVPERIPEAWLTSEMEALLESASKEQARYDGIPAAMWWNAVIRLCYDTGERIGSVISLRWSNVRGQSVLFVAENRKGGRRDILCPIKPETLRCLQAIRFDRSDSSLVFPWPRSKGYLWKRLEIILKRAGLPHGRSCKFHKIRKTTASYSAAAGLSAQEVLDHSDPKVTRRYIDPRIVERKGAADSIPALREPA